MHRHISSIFIELKCFFYFRVSTKSVIGGITPLVIIILSIFLLKEKFYMRYIIGVFTYILGSNFIIFNDRKPQSKTQILNDNIFAGILFAIGGVSLISLSYIGQKAITKEGMGLDL